MAAHLDAPTVRNGLSAPIQHHQPGVQASSLQRFLALAPILLQLLLLQPLLPTTTVTTSSITTTTNYYSIDYYYHYYHYYAAGP
jgi:hypothetical protein